MSMKHFLRFASLVGLVMYVFMCLCVQVSMYVCMLYFCICVLLYVCIVHIILLRAFDVNRRR